MVNPDVVRLLDSDVVSGCNHFLGDQVADDDVFFFEDTESDTNERYGQRLDNVSPRERHKCRRITSTHWHLPLQGQTYLIQL